MNNALFKYRTKLGLTQAEVGEALGVAKGTICKWEAGKAMPRPAMMQAIHEWSDGKITYRHWYAQKVAA